MNPVNDILRHGNNSKLASNKLPTSVKVIEHICSPNICSGTKHKSTSSTRQVGKVVWSCVQIHLGICSNFGPTVVGEVKFPPDDNSMRVEKARNTVFCVTLH